LKYAQSAPISALIVRIFLDGKLLTRCASRFTSVEVEGVNDTKAYHNTIHFAFRGWVTSAFAFVEDMSIRFKNMSLEACRRTVCCVREVHKVVLLSGCASD
jgi:hypothetical protein